MEIDKKIEKERKSDNTHHNRAHTHSTMPFNTEIYTFLYVGTLNEYPYIL